MKLVIVAGVVSLLVSLLGTPLLIRVLRRRGHSQAIRESVVGELYPAHEGKKGTPSMGGLAILAAVVIAYAAAHLATWTQPSVSGLLALFLMLGLGAVGLADDYLKIFRKRSAGIRARTKLIGQAIVAFAFAYLSTRFPDDEGLTPASRAISFTRDTKLVLPLALFLLWVWFLVTASTNAVNLTDGLDGLAAGLGLITAMAICIYSVGLLRDHGGDVLFYPPAVISVVLAGACLGFLPHNFHPARIFMGDSGSMLIGLMLAAAATTAAGPISQSAYGARDVFALLSPFLLVAAVVVVVTVIPLIRSDTMADDEELTLLRDSIYGRPSDGT